MNEEDHRTLSQGSARSVVATRALAHRSVAAKISWEGLVDLLMAASVVFGRVIVVVIYAIVLINKVFLR